MNAPQKIEAPGKANTRLWDALSKTDPAHTKQFQRAGGFRGTALKPIWVERRLTELFGPCGTGWGTEEPTFRVVEAGDEMLVYCTVKGWYIDPEKTPDEFTSDRAYVYGIGGDKVITMTKHGPKADDEAFKKAATDAIGNAFKHVGVGADIHMGQFDDSKYVAAVAKEFANDAVVDEQPPKKREPLNGPYKSKTALWTAVKEFDRTLRGIGDLAEFLAYLETAEVVELIEQCKRDAPGLWSEGLPDLPEYVPLEVLIAQQKRDLEQIDEIANSSGARNLRAG